MCKGSELGLRGAVKCHLCLWMTKQEEGGCYSQAGPSPWASDTTLKSLDTVSVGNEDSVRERRENCDGCFWLYFELLCLFLREKKGINQKQNFHEMGVRSEFQYI